MKRALFAILAVGTLLLASGAARAEEVSVMCTGGTGQDVSCDAGPLVVGDIENGPTTVTAIGGPTVLGYLGTVTVTLKSTSGTLTTVCSLNGPLDKAPLDAAGLGGSCGASTLTGEFVTDPNANCSAIGTGIGSYVATCTTNVPEPPPTE